MGNIFSFPFRKQRGSSDNCTSISSSSSASRRTKNRSLASLSSFESSIISDNFCSTPVRDSSSDSGSVNAKRASTNSKKGTDQMKQNKKSKYYYIPDNFSSLDQVTVALRESGLESSNLIIGIDFTKSNEWTGKVSFNNRSLHAIGDSLNPYEKAISIIGKTLSPFDEDNLIPCFGFGDGWFHSLKFCLQTILLCCFGIHYDFGLFDLLLALHFAIELNFLFWVLVTTHVKDVFSFHSDHSPCHGFEEVLACYRKIVPNLQLSGPTSYGPVVDAAVDIVERTGGQYHVLVIIADGQVTRSVNTSDMELSPQEEKTINSIVTASTYPLSIVLVGVGDGPWEDMQKFDDRIPARELDNFQFVNFTAIMKKHTNDSEKEAAFALAALMEIPIQYKAARELGLLGKRTGKAKKVVPRPPPTPYRRPMAFPTQDQSSLSTSAQNDHNQVCPVCLTGTKDMAFGCGHMTCRECGPKLSDCPICRRRITSRIRLYT